MSNDFNQCPHCGIHYGKREGQSPSHHKRQKYCSTSCSTKSDVGNPLKSGKNHWNWKGGVYITKSGYKKILIEGKYRLEHIVIMEKSIGRSLAKHECVHHINENRSDNRIENLELMTRSAHGRLHLAKRGFTKEEQERAAKTRKKYRKEKHSCWKQGVTMQTIEEALTKTKTRKEAATLLGIHTDTLRARLDYHKGESNHGRS